MQSKTSVSPRELNRLLAEGCSLEMLDVRTPAEYAAEHVPGARLIPLDELDAAGFLRQRGPGGQPIYILCQSGSRARRAIEMFERAGFHGCVLVEGGTKAWIERRAAGEARQEQGPAAHAPGAGHRGVCLGGWRRAGARGQSMVRGCPAAGRLRAAFRRVERFLRPGAPVGEDAVEPNFKMQLRLLLRQLIHSMKAPRRIIIVGGVAGGASAAAKARRVDETAEIQVFERGPYISFANCGLPYFIAGEIEDRAKLVIMTPQKFWERSRVRAHVNQEVLAIDRAAKTIRVRAPDGAERNVAYDKLILSQGARPIVPPIPGVELPHVFTLRDIPDMDRIAEFVNERRPQRAVVIGGGFIGLEMAEAFHHRGLRVTIVERSPRLLPLLDSDLAAHLEGQVRNADFDFKTNASAARFTRDGVELADGSRL